MRDRIAEFIRWKGISSQQSTVKGYANDLKIFCLLLHNPRVEEIKLDDVMQCLTDMADAGWTSSAMMRKCMALRKFFEFLSLQGYKVLDKNLIPIPRPVHNLPRVATDEQYKKLMAAIPQRTPDPRHIRNRCAIGMLWDSGVRIGELVSLDVNDVDTRQMKGIVRTEKNRGSRTHRPFYWRRQTNLVLKRWLTTREHIAPPEQPALFVSCVTQRVGQRITNSGVGEALRRYSNRAKLPYMNAHSFRHHLGHHIIKQGGSNADVANLLGHASLASTYTYTQMSDPEVEERYRKIFT
jgi:integrase/recombinase XerC